MKKIARIITSFIAALSLVLTPVIAHAQVQPLEVGGTSTTDTSGTIPTTGGETPATPDTGIAPAENKVAANAIVFIGGSAIGAAIGYGFLTLRKKNLKNQS